MSAEMIPFAEALELVRQHRKVTMGEAEAFLRAAIARREIRAAPDSQLAAVIQERSRYSRPPQKVEPGSALDLLRQAAAQASVNATLADAPLIGKADLLTLLSQQASPILKPAPLSVIEKVITEIYDNADRGAERPNINQLPKVALPRLEALGYTTSGRNIMEIGRADKFASRRGEPSKRGT